MNIIPLDKDSKTRRFVAHGGEAISAIAIHPAGRIFATGSAFNRFKIWDVDGSLLGSYELAPDANRRFPESMPWFFHLTASG